MNDIINGKKYVDAIHVKLIVKLTNKIKYLGFNFHKIFKQS